MFGCKVFKHTPLWLRTNYIRRITKAYLKWCWQKCLFQIHVPANFKKKIHVPAELFSYMFNSFSHICTMPTLCNRPSNRISYAKIKKLWTVFKNNFSFSLLGKIQWLVNLFGSWTADYQSGTSLTRKNQVTFPLIEPQWGAQIRDDTVYLEFGQHTRQACKICLSGKQTNSSWWPQSILIMPTMHS